VNVNGLTGDMSFPKLNIAVKLWSGGLGYMNHPLEDGGASSGWQASKDTGSSDTMYTAMRELYKLPAFAYGEGAMEFTLSRARMSIM